MSIGNTYREIMESGRITSENVAYLRAEVHDDGLVDLVEAEILFKLGAKCEIEDEEWVAFYVDALTDFYVWQSEPQGYLDEEHADHLVNHVLHRRRITSDLELELLLNVVHWAGFCPQKLVNLVLGAVWDSVTDPVNAAYGQHRLPNVIDSVDVEILRKAVYAPSTDGGFIVSAEEAEMLFKLNNATIDSANDPGWREFFTMAVATFLMFPDATSAEPAAETGRRQTWLNERRGVASLLKAVGNDSKGAGAFGSGEELELERRKEAENRARNAGENIEAEQARWLCRQIERDDVLHRNEIALLNFIHQKSPNMHESLDPLLKKAGIL